MTNLGEWTKDVRKALIDKGLTVSELAEQIGCSRTFLYRTLSETEPSQVTIDKVSELLGVEKYVYEID